MPLIIPLGVPFTGNTENVVVLPTTPPPTPIPELWKGLQCFLDTGYTGASLNILHPADYPTVAYRNFNGVRLYDAADRLRWTDPSGYVTNWAFRFVAIPGADYGYPKVTSVTARKIYNKNTLSTNQWGNVLRLAGDPVNGASNAALLTPNYTQLVIFKAEAGAIGGVVGQSEALAYDNANCGQRFGFRSVANGGKTIYQHRAGSTNRIEIDRDIANSLPVLAIITGAVNNTGNVYLKNNAVESNNAFAFAAGIPNATTDGFGMGYQDGSVDANGPKFRDILLYARWNRVLTAPEITYLKAFIFANYGTF